MRRIRPCRYSRLVRYGGERIRNGIADLRFILFRKFRVGKFRLARQAQFFKDFFDGGDGGFGNRVHGGAVGIDGVEQGVRLFVYVFFVKSRLADEFFHSAVEVVIGVRIEKSFDLIADDFVDALLCRGAHRLFGDLFERGHQLSDDEIDVFVDGAFHGRGGVGIRERGKEIHGSDVQGNGKGDAFAHDFLHVDVLHVIGKHLFEFFPLQEIIDVHFPKRKEEIGHDRRYGQQGDQKIAYEYRKAAYAFRHGCTSDDCCGLSGARGNGADKRRTDAENAV